MDQPGDVAQTRGRLDERMHGLARGRVDRRDAHLVSGVAQDLCRRIGVVLAHVGQQDMLTDTNPPRDRLTDLTRSDDDNYIHLRLFLRARLLRQPLSDRPAAADVPGTGRLAP